MSQREILVACVGKPSAGKSSLLNAISEASAKVGSFPFTTIKPNRGVAFVEIDCPCKKYGREADCKPVHGKCEKGRRFVPLQILDVAGLVPGASKGEGLGNQFLNDLTAASCLIHVVDVSGTTDEGGKNTIGYDPINDIDWLRSEIHSWIYNNLIGRLPSIQKRHIATKSSIVDSLQAQMGGYGTDKVTLNLVLDAFTSKIKDPLEKWDAEILSKFVDTFLGIRFPTVVALNKIDLPDSDKNIERIFKKYDQSKIVLISALVENFLRKLQKQKFIKYYEGTDIFDTHEQDPNLTPLDGKTMARLEKVQDLVLFRYGNTGVQELLQTVVKTLGLIPVFTVGNVNNFTSSTGTKAGIFRDCVWVRPGTTVRQLAGMINPDLDKYYNYAETVGNIKLGEEDLITHENNIISIKTSQK